MAIHASQYQKCAAVFCSRGQNWRSMRTRLQTMRGFDSLPRKTGILSDARCCSGGGSRSLPPVVVAAGEVIRTVVHRRGVVRIWGRAAIGATVVATTIQ